MSTIAFYHIDLWHRGSAVPNIELMKIYNYYYNNNDKVVMMRPQDDINRFDHIYYFKDSLASFPQTFTISHKSTTIGYGFYKKTDKLKPEFFNQPLNYTPYDAYVPRLVGSNKYSSIKKNSYVRIETEDYTDYKPDQPIIYVSDTDPLRCSSAIDFFKTYGGKHSINFLKTIYLTCDTIEKYIPYMDYFIQTIEIKDFNEQAFITYANRTNLYFNILPFSTETENNYIVRLLKMGLIYKNKGGGVAKVRPISKNTPIVHQKLIKWIQDHKSRVSLQNYYLNDSDMKKLYDIAAPKEIRLLSKSNPLTINPQTLDLRSNLCYT